MKPNSRFLLVLLTCCSALSLVSSFHGHQMEPRRTAVKRSSSHFSSPLDSVDTPPMGASLEAKELQGKLLALSERTNRGFVATNADRKEANDIITKLSQCNPTPEPARPYYEEGSTKDDMAADDFTESSLAGKWTLVYTDAPDITSLDTSRNPFSTAKLGRIGQECSPPYIKNVIEWRRPDWAANLPLSGTEESRVLQKVVTLASASPEKPTTVNLKVGGFELEAPTSGDTTGDWTESIQTEGLVAGWFSNNPVDLKGPLNPPFGQFEVLYLDEGFRAIRTYQNYLAVNQRVPAGKEWF